MRLQCRTDAVDGRCSRIGSRRWAMLVATPLLSSGERSTCQSGGVVFMRVVVRSTGVIISAVVAAGLLALTSTTTSVFTLASTTALIMGGTGHPLSTPPDTTSFVQQYMGLAVDNYISRRRRQHPRRVFRTDRITKSRSSRPSSFHQITAI
jgi:hypothetical protein